MKCPTCGYDNIAGEDSCESCQTDLTSVDGVVPKSRIERALMGRPLSELHPKEAVAITEQTSVQQAVGKMNEIKGGCLLIQNASGKIVGIVSERDILLRAIGKIKDLSKTPVSQIMTPNPETLDEDDTLACALHEMSIKRYRHIPILREGREPAVISVRDVLNCLAKLLP